MRILLENTTFHLHKVMKIAGIIRGKALYLYAYEEKRYIIQLSERLRDCSIETLRLLWHQISATQIQIKTNKRKVKRI